ncbi:MAG: BrnA antitoxin family protein [Candidatus Competibacteraceae bacterium]
MKSIPSPSTSKLPRLRVGLNDVSREEFAAAVQERFTPEQIEAAIAAAPKTPTADEDNPPTKPGDWDNAIVSYSYEELREKLAERRRQRGPQKAPLKVPTTIRFDADVLAALKATGKGWQTRVNQVVRDWLASKDRAAE